MTVSQLALDEPLSPELVLVLPQELRAEVLAALPDHPVRPVPRRLSLVPAPPAPALAVAEPAAPLPAVAESAVPIPAVAAPAWPSLVAMIATRALTLGTIFVGVTLVTLVLALVAQATAAR